MSHTIHSFCMQRTIAMACTCVTVKKYSSPDLGRQNYEFEWDPSQPLDFPQTITRTRLYTQETTTYLLDAIIGLNFLLIGHKNTKLLLPASPLFCLALILHQVHVTNIVVGNIQRYSYCGIRYSHLFIFYFFILYYLPISYFNSDQMMNDIPLKFL